MRKLTTEEFIEKAKAVHGTMYEYSKTVYENSRKRVSIICSVHGEFKQVAMDHLCGSGCMKCSGKNKLIKEEFEEKAKLIHGNTYDYSKVNIINSKTKVEIICSKHGSFWQTPENHINKMHGCAKCMGGRKYTKEEFIIKAISIHENTYSYENVHYVGIATNIKIDCSIHGTFIQTPNAHLTGQGCPKCGIIKRGNKRKLTIQQFIKRANVAHNNYYKYNKIIYTNIDSKVLITCPKHGDFEQSPYLHLKKHGCPNCALHGFNPSKSAYLYYLKIITNEGKILYKIGVTNRTVNERFSLVDLSKIEIIKQKLYENGQDAYNWEQKMLKMYKKYKYKGPKILDSGNTELFTEDVLALYYAKVN